MGPGTVASAMCHEERSCCGSAVSSSSSECCWYQAALCSVVTYSSQRSLPYAYCNALQCTAVQAADICSGAGFSQGMTLQV